MTKDKLDRSKELCGQIELIERGLAALHCAMENMGYKAKFLVDGYVGTFSIPVSVLPDLYKAYEKSLLAYQKEFDEL